MVRIVSTNCCPQEIIQELGPELYGEPWDSLEDQQEKPTETTEDEQEKDRKGVRLI